MAPTTSQSKITLEGKIIKRIVETGQEELSKTSQQAKKNCLFSFCYHSLCTEAVLSKDEVLFWAFHSCCRKLVGLRRSVKRCKVKKKKKKKKRSAYKKKVTTMNCSTTEASPDSGRPSLSPVRKRFLAHSGEMSSSYSEIAISQKSQHWLDQQNKQCKSPTDTNTTFI